MTSIEAQDRLDRLHEDLGLGSFPTKSIALTRAETIDVLGDLLFARRTIDDLRRVLADKEKGRGQQE